jgi:hypothetical protein
MIEQYDIAKSSTHVVYISYELLSKMEEGLL